MQLQVVPQNLDQHVFAVLGHPVTRNLKETGTKIKVGVEHCECVFMVLVCRTGGSGSAQTWESLLQWSEVRMRPGRLLGRSSRLKYHTRFQ